jgi:DNA processing protein
VPGNVLSGRNRGGHALIRDGAAIVECAADVVAALGLEPARIKSNGGTADESPGQADPLLARMKAGEPYDVDALAGLSELDAARLLPRLADLELRGLVRRIGGGRFVRP